MCHLNMFCGRLCLGQRLPQHTLAALRTACRQHKRLSVHCACCGRSNIVPRRFLNYFFDYLEYPAVEDFCKVRRQLLRA